MEKLPDFRNSDITILDSILLIRDKVNEIIDDYNADKNQIKKERIDEKNN